MTFFNLYSSNDMLLSRQISISRLTLQEIWFLKGSTFYILMFLKLLIILYPNEDLLSLKGLKN